MGTRRRGDLRLTDNEVGGWKPLKVNNLMNFTISKNRGGGRYMFLFKNSILGVKNVILLKHYNSDREKSLESKY